MLDYAANGQKYWPVDRMRSIAMERLGGVEQLSEAVLDLMGAGAEEGDDELVEQFWTRAAENLRSGKVRLVFVADSIPAELRRVLEFLNEQMPRLHVVGLELVQYHGSGLPQILVPRVVGQTEATREMKKSSSGGPYIRTTRKEFLKGCPSNTGTFFEEQLGEAESRDMDIYWGKLGFSVRLKEEVHGRHGSIMYGWPATGEDSPHPVFQVYLHERMLSPNEQEYLRAAVLDAAPFTGGGKYTLSLPITQETMASARKAMKVILDWEESLRDSSQDEFDHDMDDRSAHE